MKVLKHIPNTLTSLNLSFGAIGVLMAFQGRPDLTAYAVLIAAFFDFTDGFAARMLKAYSDIGKELDSLADLVSFGLAPSAAYISILHFYFTGEWKIDFFALPGLSQLILILPFVLAIFSALRLAKFNVDTRQTESFLGLTTTATGMFSVSLIFMVFTRGGNWNLIASPYVVFPMLMVFCALLVSEIPMFSLKFKNFNLAANILRYMLLATGLVSVVFLGIGGVAVTILVYILFSVVRYLKG
jgi:CDP-diacylglycerol--serine O-phosphatidyltransferase